MHLKSGVISDPGYFDLVEWTPGSGGLHKRESGCINALGRLLMND